MKARSLYIWKITSMHSSLLYSLVFAKRFWRKLIIQNIFSHCHLWLKVLDPSFVLPIGKAKVMKAGSDITIVGHSIGVGFAMDAAVELEKQGTDANKIYF